MTTYRVLVADTRTGEIVDELGYSGFNHTQTVDWSRGDSMTVDVPLQGMRSPSKPRVIQLTHEPWKRSLVLTADNVALFAGPMIGSDFSQDTVSFTCAGIPKLFDKRFLFRDYTGTMTLNANQRDAIGYLLYYGMTGGTGLELPITNAGPESWFGGSDTPLGNIDRTYVGLDLASVYESVKKVTEEDGAPDVRLQSILSADGSMLSWDVRYGGPYLGSSDPSVRFSYPGNVRSLSGSYDGEAMISRGYSVGNGDAGGGDQIIAFSDNSALVDDGFPFMESADRTSSSSRDTFAVQASADSYTEVNSYQTTSWSLTVSADFPKMGSWEVGDNAEFDVTDHASLANGIYLRRVTGFTLTQDSLSLETMEPQ